MTVTKQNIRQAIEIASAVAKAIHDLGSVPNGKLYAQVSAAGMPLETYTSIIKLLKDQGLVAETNNVLTWVGPKD